MNFKKYILVPAMKKSGATTLWLLKIILPISLVVRFLGYFGVLEFLAGFLDPVFMNLGLPGSTAIIFITSVFLPLYAPLAIITSMSLTLRELTILALICQIAHNLPVESAVQAKTGTTFWGMTTLRITMSILTGYILNVILPADMGMPLFVQSDVVVIDSIGMLLLIWIKSSLKISILITVVIFSLNLLYNLLHAFKLIPKLSKGVEPLLKFFGLSANTGFLWLIGYIVGVAYGGALMMDQLKDGRVTQEEANLLNHHLAVSHSAIEDNLLFVALGVSIWWILGVRFALAWVVVWSRRLIIRLSSRKKVNYNAYF